MDSLLLDQLTNNNDLIVRLSKTPNTNDLDRKTYVQLVMFNITIGNLITCQNHKDSSSSEFKKFKLEDPFSHDKYECYQTYFRRMMNNWERYSQDPIIIQDRIYRNTNLKKDAY